MSKICKNCQNECSDSAKFCTNCGGSEFIETPAESETEILSANPEQEAASAAYEQPVYQQPTAPEQPLYQQPQYQQPQYQQPAAPQYDAQPVEAPKKKKLPGWAIALIIVGAVLVVFIGGCFGCVGCIACLGNNIDTTDNPPINIFTLFTENTEDTENVWTESTVAVTTDPVYIDEIAYTKGEFNGVYYNNKWADIKYYLPEGFSEAEDDEYSDIEDDATDCGFCFVDEEYTQVGYILFMKLEDEYFDYDETDFLDELFESFTEDEGWTVNRTYKNEYVSGHVYMTANAAYNDGDEAIVESFYVRKLDDRMIVFFLLGDSADSNKALFNQIENAD